MNRTLSSLLMVTLLTACGGGGSGSTTNTQNGPSSGTGTIQYEAVELPTPIDGIMYNDPVTYRYGVAIAITPGAPLFDSSRDPSLGYDFAIILSNNPIHCGHDFRFSNHAPGAYLAILFTDNQVGATASESIYMYKENGWVHGGGADLQAQIEAVSSNAFSGSVNQNTTESVGGVNRTFQAIGNFTVQSCL